jgi:hypothetical protein
MRGGAVLAAGVVAAILLAAAPAFADGWTYSGSVGYANGDYTLPEETTTILLLNGLSWSGGRWWLVGSLPVIYQDTSNVSYAGGTPVPAPEATKHDDTGVGDPLLRADFRLSRSLARAVGAFVSAKLPVADRGSGFGTDEWDFGGGITFGVAAGRGRLYGELGAWSYGDSPDLELEDPLVVTLGYLGPPHPRWSWIVSVSGASEGFDDAEGPVEASATLDRRLEHGRALSLTLAAGITETAPDLRIVIAWRAAL